MKTSTIKRALAFCFALLMVISLMPLDAITANAASSECEHKNAENLNTVPADCYYPGLELWKCSDCNATYTKELPATGEHNMVENTCTVCGLTCTTHDYETIRETKPTCVDYGYVAQKCTVCGDEKNWSPDPTGVHMMENGSCGICGFTPDAEFTCEHKNTEVVAFQEADCYYDGFELTRCIDCGATTPKVLPATGEHNMVENTCTVCGLTCTDHNYVTVKETKPTCVDYGYVAQECTVCGDEKNWSPDPTGVHMMENGSCSVCGYTPQVEATCKHENAEIVNSQPADCYYPGVELWKCADCGATYTKELPATGEHNMVENTCTVCGLTCVEHDYVVVQEIKANCVNYGYVAMECSVCGYEKNYSPDPTGIHVVENGSCSICGYIPEQEFVCEHADSEVVTSLDPDCYYDGFVLYQCSDCGATFTKILPATGIHNMVSDICTVCGLICTEHNYETVKEIRPTCVEYGYVAQKCSICGNEKNWSPDPTNIHMMENGSCGVCGYTPEQELVCEHKDSEVIESKPADCYYPGVELWKCSDCGATYTKELPATGKHDMVDNICTVCGLTCSEHDYVVVKELAPTCAEAGYAWYKCSVCGDEMNHEVGEPTDEHGETYKDIMEADCSTEGYSKDICKVCGQTVSEEILEKNDRHYFYDNKCLKCGACDHDYVIVKEQVATCAEAGYAWYECSRCGDEMNGEVGEPSGEHTYVVVKELAPTCAEAGYAWYECSVCGDEMNHEVGEPSGEHGETYKDIMEADCSTDGYSKDICKVCGQTISEEILEKNERHYFYNNKCLKCGACEHDYVVVKEQAPTCTEAGYAWYECSVCGDEMNSEVGEPSGIHVYEGGFCAVCGDIDPNYTPETSEPEVIKPSEPEEIIPSEPDVSKPEAIEPEVTRDCEGKAWLYKATDYIGSFFGSLKDNFGDIKVTMPTIPEKDVSSEFEATEPEATKPEATEPEATEPEATEPEATEPEATKPEATEPEATEPETTEPEATEPEVTEPEVTEPEATEPEATEPEATEPEATEPEAEQVYNVTLDPKGGKVDSTLIAVTVGKSYGSLPVPVRSGYTFTGWELIVANVREIVNAETIVSVEGDHTLYATWSANSYQVTFDVNGGSAITETTRVVTFNQPYGALETPTRSGYTFKGWKNQVTGEIVVENSLVSTGNDHTLVAIWVGADGKVDSGNGSVSGSVNGSVAQTGQISWPIPVLIVLGLAMFVGGSLLIVKQRKGKNEA